MSEDEPLSETERALKKQGIEYHRDEDGTLIVPGNAFASIFGDDEDDDAEAAPAVAQSAPVVVEQPVYRPPAPVSTRVPITGAFNNADIVRTLAEGNPTAAAIVTAVLNDPFLGGPLTLLRLDDMNLRGKQIAAAFEYCENSLPSFLTCVVSHDERMINYVNSVVSDEKAVMTGGSFNRTLNLKFGA